jgi:transcriptional regulator with XRE-family HTH domain
MSRFHQRLHAALRDPEVLVGFQAMEAQRALQGALEAIRERQGLTKEQIAERMGCHRASVSRVLTAADANPTLETLIALFQALGTTADITFRQAKAGESPITTSVVPQESALNGNQSRHVSVPAPATSLSE